MSIDPIEQEAFNPRLKVQIGSVVIGGGELVKIQSMTQTPTAHIEATVQQIMALTKAGSDLVRITVNDEEAAKAVPFIKEKLMQSDCLVPLIGDFHYNGHRLLTQYPDCAQSLDKYRINPGNVGFSGKKDQQFGQMIDIALRYQKVVRMGANWGSLDATLVSYMMDRYQNTHQAMKEAMIASVIQSAEQAVKLGMRPDSIVLSCKVSSAPLLIDIYESLAKRTVMALHLGLTEAGMGLQGAVAVTAALSPLLRKGIGDTIRASITNATDRTQEVILCQHILQSLQIRAFRPTITACPGCGRTSSLLYQELAQATEKFIEERFSVWQKQYPGIESLKIAVMGCVVNGPGESRHADIGISLPGDREEPVAPVFLDGKKYTTLRGQRWIEEFCSILESYVHQRFGGA